MLEHQSKNVILLSVGEVREIDLKKVGMIYMSVFRVVSSFLALGWLLWRTAWFDLGCFYLAWLWHLVEVLVILRILVNAWSLAGVATWTTSDGHPSLLSVKFVRILWDSRSNWGNARNSQGKHTPFLSWLLRLHLFIAFMHVCSVVSDSAISRTVARQAPLFMRFSRQEYWSVLPFPPPGDLPNQGIKPTSPASPALASKFFTTVPPFAIFFFLHWQLNWLLNFRR